MAGKSSSVACQGDKHLLRDIPSEMRVTACATPGDGEHGIHLALHQFRERRFVTVFGVAAEQFSVVAHAGVCIKVTAGGEKRTTFWE